MGKEYLSEAAVFACPLGMRFKAMETANQKAKYHGSKLLTAAAILRPNQPPIPCSYLPPLPSGTPTPCPCAVGPLAVGVKHRAGTNLLTEDAKALCTAGQSVKALQSGTKGHILYKEARAAQVLTIAWPAREADGAQEAETRAEAQGKSERNPSLQGDAVRPAPRENTVQASEKPSLKKEATVEEQAVATKREEVPPFRDGMLCSCSKNKEQCMACSYRLDNEAATVDNNSIILRKNYDASKPHTEGYDRYFDEVVAPLGDGKENRWRYAAHHLISGNQVFKQNPELVRLARFCGYDINAYANCIMLVGYPEDYPDDERMKSVKAYEVMSEGRVQWHVGGHSYTFAEDEKAMICKQIGIRNKIKLTPPDVKTYAELVQVEIEKLQQRLTAKKNQHRICYAEQQEKRRLCSKLDYISNKIKEKLAAFSDVGKPHHSFPFFVSKEAYRYTYALPRTGKVITVLQEGTHLTLSMFRLEHFTEVIAEQKKHLVIKPKAAVVLELSDEAWRQKCVIFCENVESFVYLEDTPRDVLCFTVAQEHQFPTDIRATGKDGLRFLQEHDTEILVWLREQTVSPYVSPALMTKNRLKELELNKEADGWRNFTE